MDSRSISFLAQLLEYLARADLAITSGDDVIWELDLLPVTVQWNLIQYMSPQGFPSSASGKELSCQCRRCKRCGFDPWVRKIPRRRKWQPTPIFLLGKSHGQRSLSGYSLCGHKESDMTEHKLGIKNAVLYFSLPGGGFANCPVREITIFGIEWSGRI